MLVFGCSYVWGSTRPGTCCKECHRPYYLMGCISQKSVRRVGRVAFAERSLFDKLVTVGSGVLVCPHPNKYWAT